MKHLRLAPLALALLGLTLAAATPAASFPGVAVFGPAGSGSAADDPDIDFEGLGKAFQGAFCPQGAGSAGGECELEEALAASFAHMVLGTFEVHFPVTSLGDKGHAKDFITALVALVDMQSRWIDWLAGDRESARAAQADLALLRGWIDGWKAGDLAKVTTERSDLYEHFEAPAEVREAAQRLADYLHDEDELGLVIPDEDQFAQVMFCPDRLTFMQAVGFAGLQSEAERDMYWHGGVHEWTQIWVGWTFTLALEYAPWGGLDKSFKQGLEMNKFEKTGLQEHVIQRCTMALFRYCRPGYDPGHLGTATALAMAIEICGQVKTIDGVGARGTSGAQTQAYERFVPGGNSQGGVLPAIPAAPFNVMTENHWRRGGGKDYFKAPLEKGQKDGAKKIKKYDKDHPLVDDKTAHFLLEGYAKGGKWVVSAPFFGEHANEKLFPDSDFMIDYREFFRSYKAAFFHWLRHNGVPDSEEESIAKFRELLRRYAEVDDEVPVHDLVLEIYGVPMSADNGEIDNLEWRFLGWLAK